MTVKSVLKMTLIMLIGVTFACSNTTSTDSNQQNGDNEAPIEITEQEQVVLDSVDQEIKQISTEIENKTDEVDNALKDLENAFK